MTKRTHLLKTLPRYWEALDRGDKTFEVRRDDRAYTEGDTLILRRYEPTPHRVTDNWCGARQGLCPWESHHHEDEDLYYEITYVLPGGKFGIDPDYVVLGLGQVRCDTCRAPCVAGHAVGGSLACDDCSGGSE